MSDRIAFLLSLLVLASHADASGLKDYFLKDIGRASRIRLDGEYEHGFVLKNSPGPEPFSATLKVLPENNDGVVFVYHFFKLDNSSGKRDTLEMNSNCSTKEFSRNCSRHILERDADEGWKDVRPTISYKRRENSTSRFELTLTAFTDPPCGGKFECGNRICVWAELRCDGRDNCGDGSDERGCNGTEICEDGSNGRGCNSTDYCEDGFVETGNNNFFFFFFCLWMGITVFICLTCIFLQRKELSEK